MEGYWAAQSSAQAAVKARGAEGHLCHIASMKPMRGGGLHWPGVFHIGV